MLIFFVASLRDTRKYSVSLSPAPWYTRICLVSLSPAFGTLDSCFRRFRISGCPMIVRLLIEFSDICFFMWGELSGSLTQGKVHMLCHWPAGKKGIFISLSPAFWDTRKFLISSSLALGTQDSGLWSFKISDCPSIVCLIVCVVFKFGDCCFFAWVAGGYFPATSRGYSFLVSSCVFSSGHIQFPSFSLVVSVGRKHFRTCYRFLT